MKMIYGGVPVNSLKVKHYEMDTNDCDMLASDLQAGKTAVARGQKITGTGKSFEFAYYGEFETNDSMPIPTKINVVHFSSLEYPTQELITLNNMKHLDFANGQIVGNIVINGESFPVTVTTQDAMISVSCDQTVNLQIFFGKDNYI